VKQPASESRVIWKDFLENNIGIWKVGKEREIRSLVVVAVRENEILGKKIGSL
jgi:hypothetical protein